MSVEDYSLYHAEDTPFRNIKSAIVNYPSIYIESVENPVNAITIWGGKSQTYHEIADNIHGISKDFTNNDKITVYVHLPTTINTESRKAALSHNDEIIGEIVSSVRKTEPDLAVVFTGRRSLWDAPSTSNGNKRISRHLLESSTDVPSTEYASSACKDPIIQEVSSSLLLYVCAIQVDGKLVNETKLPVNVNGTSFGFTLSAHDSDIKFAMKFTPLPGGAWESSAKINGINTKINQDVYAPSGFSYHCTPGTTFKSGNITITFKEFQVEPLYGGSRNVSSSFSRPYDCIGMMSVPILSSLFIVLILTLIMAWALTMIMNIKTMDRFDDPKGASISVPLTD